MHRRAVYTWQRWLSWTAICFVYAARCTAQQQMQGGSEESEGMEVVHTLQAPDAIDAESGNDADAIAPLGHCAGGIIYCTGLPHADTKGKTWDCTAWSGAQDKHTVCHGFCCSYALNPNCCSVESCCAWAAAGGPNGGTKSIDGNAEDEAPSGEL